MIELGVYNITKLYGADKIFENITFDIKSKEKVGLIGSNGTGKTTLMKILMGSENYQVGEVYKRKGNKIGYLEQIPDYPEDYNAKDVLSLAFTDIYNIKKEMDNLEKEFNLLEGNELDKAVKKYGQLQEEFQRLGGYDQEEKMSKITVGLNIPIEMQNRKFNKLSGGEKSRIILGKILLENPDVLLLDEPSNHLDMSSIEWLEEYLKGYDGAVLIISHDRYFLDRVVNRIIELESNGVQIYNGNYSYYVVEKEIRFINALKEYNNQQKKIKKMEDQIERYRIWGKMRDSEKMFKRAKELEKRLVKIEKLDKPILEKRKIRLNISGTSRTGKEVLNVENISKSFEDKRVLKNITFKVFYMDSIGILGENGTGKSTLLKIIMGDISADTGQTKFGSRTSIGYLPQEITFENENISIVDSFTYRYSITTSEARKELAKALFTGDDVFKLISSLSGGEKSRLKLAMLMYEKVNVLILDEPTNHLDIDSREVLEESLINYEGTIIFVSHDRYFVNKIATKIAEIEKGNLKVYNHNYEGYKEEKNRIAEKKLVQIKSLDKKKELKKKNKNEDYKKRNDKQKLIKKVERELLSIESDISILEDNIKSLEQQMSENSSNADKLNEIYVEHKNKKVELQKLYKNWEEISSKLDSIKN